MFKYNGNRLPHNVSLYNRRENKSIFYNTILRGLCASSQNRKCHSHIHCGFCYMYEILVPPALKVDFEHRFHNRHHVISTYIVMDKTVFCCYSSDAGVGVLNDNMVGTYWDVIHPVPTENCLKHWYKMTV